MQEKCGWQAGAALQVFLFNLSLCSFLGALCFFFFFGALAFKYNFPTQNGHQAPRPLTEVASDQRRIQVSQHVTCQP